MSAPYTKLEAPLHRLAVVCRGCLAESGEMKNIFEWGISEEFFEVTSIEPARIPNISELLCASCEDLMMKCKQFRERCQMSDKILKTSLESREQISALKLIKNQVTCSIEDEKLIVKIVAPKSDTQIRLPCPFTCTDKFVKKSDLDRHLKEKHSVAPNFEIELRYFCAEPDCKHNELSEKQKWFTGRKFLNQHLNKKHKTKSYYCNNCKKAFATEAEVYRHTQTCNFVYICQICDINYATNEKLMVHLKRKHPFVHKMYKKEKAEKRKMSSETEAKKLKTELNDEIVTQDPCSVTQENLEKVKPLKFEFCDSPKKSSATQIPEDIKNDVTLWQSKTDYEVKTDEISTQTMFEDLLSLKSQNSEDEFYSEAVSLSDIQTQTIPLEFGLSRSNKETQFSKNSQTQSPDLSIKETQTCFCHYDSPKPNFRLFDSLSSSPASINLTSTETQTADKNAMKTDMLFNSTETQTCFDDSSNDSM